ncbi:DUF2194 domain-containing protein [Clostridium perfringens]|uniref:DUF2194 domain-containing protein n=1 Tax=Clostridium perfringens TaxID=1502 RepID=UPI0022469C55|nr:DUF2194 domain-containing protein [Clostridium perfringens]MCX0380446.1 DUF2194 domain-containing protein [Clostridium perfringens]
MFSKKFVFSFLSLSLLLGLLLSFMKINYVFDKIDNTNITNLNNKRFSSTQYNEIKNNSYDKFLILCGNGEEDNKIYENFKVILEDMDKQLIKLPINEFKGDTTGYRGVIINDEYLEDFNYLSQLIDYVKKGGNLIFSQRPLISDNLKSISKDIGIEKILSNDPIDADSMHVMSNILIKGYGLKRTKDTENSSLKIELTKDSLVHMHADKDIPLLWEKNLENGKIIFSNGQFLSEKGNRGLLTGVLYRTGKNFIYPIINSKVFDIDDFPAPIPKNISENIFDEYKMNDQKFFTNIWWPDIVEICSKYNLKPTGYLIYNYQDVTKDIENFEGDAYYESLITQGRNLFKIGGELGIHGFNHQPLRTEGYKDDSLGYNSWKDYNTMVNAQIALNKFIHTIYPNYEVKGYVPPSNIISEEGISALKKGFPSVNVISSLYVVSKEDIAYEQEFSKGADGIYNFPRYSSGYDYEEFDRWMVYNGITINGVFSHFIHPDDILDPERNHGLSWEGLKKDFTKLMSEVYDNFKWLKSDTISQGVDALNEYLTTKSAFSYKENSIKGSLEYSGKNDYFILRTDKPITKSIGCSYEKIDDELYLIHSTETDFEIILGGN